MQLLERKGDISLQIVPEVLEKAPDAILLVSTNPVDVLTHMTADIVAQIGLPNSHAICSGSTLDLARFRTLLSQHPGVDPQHVHAYVLGERGDSEVLTWSLVTVGGAPLEEFCRQCDICMDGEVRADILQGVKLAVYSIIEGKGIQFGTHDAKLYPLVLSRFVFIRIGPVRAFTH